MKTRILTALYAAIVTLSLATIGCSNATDPQTDNSASVDEQVALFIRQNASVISDDGLLFPEMDTMCPRNDVPFEMREGHHGGKGGKHGGMGGHHGGIGHKGDFRKPLNKFDSLRLVLPCLKLTAEQDSNLRVLLAALHQQVDSIMKATREAQLPLRQEAQAKAKLVLDSLKAGTITRDQAKADLDAIRQELETALQPGRDAAKAAIKALQSATLTAIRGILTAEQVAAYDIWLSTGQLPC